MQNRKRFYVSALVWAVVLGILYLAKRYNFLLFHAMAEMFSVAVAGAIFMLVWNVRRSLDNSYLLFVGVAYLFIGCLDLVHTLAYQGMGLFRRYEANLQGQLWVASRYMESLSLLIGSFFLGRRLKLGLVLAGYVAATALVLGSIFYWDVFPACFVEGAGLTPFKKLSVYIIVLILAAAIAVLVRKKAQFDPTGLRFMVASVAFTIVSESCFSFFTDVYGIPYFLGHFFKLVSLYCIYKAIIELGMSKPFAVLFKNLKESEDSLRRERDLVSARVRERTAALVETNAQLADEIEDRRRAEEALQMERNKLSSILEAMPDGAYIINQQYDIKYANPVIEKEFGPIQARKCHEYFHGSREICSWCRNPEVFSGKNVRREWCSSKTGRTYDIIDTPIFNNDGAISKMVILRDITERKSAEDALRESEKQLRDLSSRLLTAQETERRRISRELHDELGGALAVLKLRTSMIEKNLQPDQAAIREDCKQNLQYIDQIIDEVHRLSRDLSPSILEDIGLTPALRWLIDNFARHYGVKADTHIENVDHLLPRDDQIMLYRTFQEALTNIGKHAQAGNAVVEVRAGEDRISVLVEDDGRGFDAEALSAKTVSEKGLGLATMNERARMLGGGFHLASEHGKGTRITLSIPIQEGERD